jgi:CRP-like cAMP-binding protein
MGSSMLSQADVLDNHLLSLLPDHEVDEMLPHLEPIDLEVRTLAYDVNQPIEYAYFPKHGVISILGVMKDRTAVEVATMGNEAMIGLPLFLGTNQVIGQAFVQVAGAAVRMPAAAFKIAAQQPRFREVLNLYTVALLTQIGQSAACNRLHLTEERFARWLLMTHDRVGRDQFLLTQDFLSQMLGVRRATVSEIAAQAQRDGAIEYSRGRLTIVNRDGLENMTCECYGLIRSEYERLLGKPARAPTLRSQPRFPRLSEDGKSLISDGSPRENRRHSPELAANGSSE